MCVTGMQFADTLRDAGTLCGGMPQYDWVRAWKTVRGVPLGIAAREAAAAAGQTGLLALWLRECAKAFCGRYTASAPEFALAMDCAADALAGSGATLFPAAVRAARTAKGFSAWSAAAYAGGLRASANARADERVFLPWLCAMCARYAQE